MANVRLCSHDDSYVIAVEFWGEVLGGRWKTGGSPNTKGFVTAVSLSST